MRSWLQSEFNAGPVFYVRVVSDGHLSDMHSRCGMESVTEVMDTSVLERELRNSILGLKRWLSG